MKRFFAAVAVLLCTLTLSAQTSLKKGDNFLDFKGYNIDDNQVTLSEWVGNGKCALVDFWASWCGPCRMAIPHIIKMYDKYAAKGLNVLGVAVWDKKEETLKAIEELGINYPVMFCGKDRMPTQLYGIEGIPTIIVFDGEGKIVAANLWDEAEIEKAVKKALGIK